MREACADLTELTVPTRHGTAQERADLVNVGLARWVGLKFPHGVGGSTSRPLWIERRQCAWRLLMQLPSTPSLGPTPGHRCGTGRPLHPDLTALGYPSVYVQRTCA